MAHAVIDTEDLGEVEQLLRAGGTPARIETGSRGPAGPFGSFAFAADVQTDGELSLTRYRAAGDWTLHAEADVFTVMSATTATPRWTRGDECGDFAGAPVLLPPGSSSATIDGLTDVFEVRLTPRVVERTAADLRGVEAVRLGSGRRTPRSPTHAQYWAEVMRYTRHLFESGLLHDERLVASLKTNLVATMLDGYSLVEGVRDWRLTPAGTRAVYLRARTAIDDATRTVTAPEVARTAGLPLQVLDRLFRTQSGQTVHEALRAARVRGARSQLLRTEPTSAAAAEVVRAWGFTALADYLALHRAQYPGRALPFEAR